jgi:hypothetical protein
VIVLLVGVGTGLRLMHKRLRPIRSTSDLLLLDLVPALRRLDLAPAISRVRTLFRRWSRGVLSGLDWLVAEPLRLLVKR